MKRWVSLVALLIALLLMFSLTTPRPTVKANFEQSQIRLLDPTGKARTDNAKRLKTAIVSFNLAGEQLNKELVAAKVWESVKPDKVLSHIQKMRDELAKAEEILLHYDEIEP